MVLIFPRDRYGEEIVQSWGGVEDPAKEGRREGGAHVSAHWLLH